ncbi:hypothetical protein COT75_02795 [Candidatus Beckwithbacteria bacterium CG10_big_fil_rev_8_21_14_0_10_34_10]|uniref:DUF4012 domain-containing protein n=1 Tax=Candidatus Beckwithbacteria bacterium CG10_big_fil_rev_8_21_14_0_10_34_10 TaxID=1974495 RepID=A0A2H0W928_9BACT|nr:MAG: hypothetical protein COT75_02795 [Candidatus Beckwithbacteria bacterium CG10_big_fil_rev_8_21_14_0_10_34_10]
MVIGLKKITIKDKSQEKTEARKGTEDKEIEKKEDKNIGKEKTSGNKETLFPSDLKKEKIETNIEKASFSTSSKKKFKLKLPRFKLPQLKKKALFIPLLVILGFFLLLAVPTLILAKPLISSAKKTYLLAQEAYQAGKNQDLVLAEEKISQTEESLKETEKKYSRLAYLKIIPFVSSYYEDGQSLLKAGLSGIQAGEVMVAAITPYADVLGFTGQGSFMGGTAEDRIVKIVQTLEKVTSEIDAMADKLEAAQEELSKINPKRYPEEFRGKKIRENIIIAKKTLAETSKGISEAKPILSVLPEILGYPDKKKYLVIFQNDGELRATGGFMTAFSVLEFDSGKVRSLKSDDIYSLDKKYKPRIEAPESIEKYLFSSDLDTGIVPYFYLRDMNLSPDFKVSMDTFIKYYDKVPGEEEVDGIITVDTYVLKDLIDILGPIDVPGYGKFTTEEDQRCHGVANVICELEYIVDQPLPTQAGNRKQTILGPMMQQIMFKAMGSPKQLWPDLFSTGLRLLKEKHVLLYFSDSYLEEAAQSYGAAGRIKPYEWDYLHINDSNFGGAKSNLFTNHKVEQEIEINESGEIIKTLTLTYENPEPTDNCNLERKEGLCLNSILRNYIRIYVPEGSKLIESLGSEVEMETKTDLGKTYFDGFFTVRGGGGRAKLVLKYKLPFNLTSGDNYKLLIQKQPGTEGHQYQVIFGDQEEEFELREDKEIEFNF